MTYYKRSSS